MCSGHSRAGGEYWTLARWWGVQKLMRAGVRFCSVPVNVCGPTSVCVCVTSLRGQGVDSMHCRAVSGREPNIVLTTAAKPTQSWGVSGPILGTLFEQKWAPFLGARMGAVFWPNL